MSRSSPRTRNSGKTENMDNSDDIETIEDDDNSTAVEDEAGDVITVMDTGEDLPCKTIPDVVFYDSVSEEEKLYYSENCLEMEVVEEMKVQCTACWKQVNHHLANMVQRHPSLGVAVCRTCIDFFQDGEWEKDEEGTDIFCRWCGNGGEVLGCDECSQVFCKRCITRNLGRTKFSEIQADEKWSCFSCDPSQIYKERALMLSISKWSYERRNLKRQKEKEKLVKKKIESSLKKAEVRKIEKEKKIETELGKIENFIDENIHEAFDTLEIYQKCLEEERRKWIRTRKSINSNNAATVAKSLRRIFAVTKQNMELLDTALVQGYGEHFPDESVETKLKFNLGGAAKFTSQVEETTPSKSTPVKSVSTKRKMKFKTPVEDDDIEEIVMDGDPVYSNATGEENEENIDPSLLCSVEITGVENPEENEEYPESTPRRRTKVTFIPSNGVKNSPKPLPLNKKIFKNNSTISRGTKKPRKKAKYDDDIEEVILNEDDDSTGYVSQSSLG